MPGSKDGWPLGRLGDQAVSVSAERAREGVLVVGSTGSGKSTCIGIPALMWEAETDRSLVAIDLKYELTPKTIGRMMHQHRVFTWSPSGLLRQPCPIAFDPLATLPDVNHISYIGEVKALAHTFFWATREGRHTSDPFFITMPRAVMEAMFLAFVTSHPQGTFLGLAEWVRRVKLEELQKILDTSPHPEVHASAEMLANLAATERTLGGLLADVSQRFDIVGDPSVRRSMQGASIDWEEFVRRPTAVYVMLAARDGTRLQPLVSLFLGTAYRALMRIAERHQNNVLPRGVDIILDEFGQLSHVEGMAEYLATVRSYNIRHLVMVQGTAQIRHRYGAELAESIIGNLLTKVYLGGLAWEDARTASQMCGQVTEHIEHDSNSAQGWLGRSSVSHGYTPHNRPLVAPEELMSMTGKGLVISRGVRPFMVQLQPYYQDREMMKRVAEGEAWMASLANAPTWDSTQQSAEPPAAGLHSSAQGSGAAGRTAGAEKPMSIRPPTCSEEEWARASVTVQEAVFSLSMDLGWLRSGNVTLAVIHAEWAKWWPFCTPERLVRISPVDAALVPTVMDCMGAASAELGVEDWLRTKRPTESGITGPVGTTGCSRAEWDACPISIKECWFSLGWDLCLLAEGRCKTMSDMHASWATLDPFCSPRRYARISEGEALQARGVMPYLRRNAARLGVQDWLGVALPAWLQTGQSVPPEPVKTRPTIGEAEWLDAPWSVKLARRSLENDLAALRNGTITPERLQKEWGLRWPNCAPAHFAQVRPAEAAMAPNVWQYVTELAHDLGLMPGKKEPFRL